MNKSVTIILVRHGESVGNVTKVVQGQTGGELTERGIEQAREIAASLADSRIDAAYTSDLKRALDTAEILLDGREGLEALRDPRLREQDLGVYVGGPVESYEDAITKAGTVRERFDPEGGEPSGSLRARVESFLSEMIIDHAGETVLVVTHQGVMRMVAELYPDKLDNYNYKLTDRVIYCILA